MISVAPAPALRRLLPYSTPPVRAYLHHAYTTGMLMAAGHANLVLNAYIQLEVRINDVYAGQRYFLDFSPFTDIALGVAHGLCETTEAPVASIASLAARDVIALLHHWLAADIYVEAYVDEFYVPGAPAFRTHHLAHPLLLIGFDRAAKTFRAVTMRKDSRFGPLDLGEEALARAIAEQPKLTAPATAHKWMRSVKFRPGAVVSLDPEHIRAELISFMTPPAGLTPSPQLWQHSELIGSVFGRHCNDYVRRHLHHAQCSAQAIDMRLPRLLWERAELMVRRIRCLREQAAVERLLEEQFEALATTFHRIHLSSLQFNLDLKAGRRDRRVDCGAALTEATDLELRLTEQLVAQLA